MPIKPNIADIKIIECPRDAMQGLQRFIPTALKVEYLNKLLKVGFHTIDCASFVSPKAIPQLSDSREVLDQIDFESSPTKLSVIVANSRGARDASSIEQVDYLGYPFSISEQFQQRNTNKSITESVDVVKEILDLCDSNGKEMVIYISMGFGNPYGEEWSSQLVVDWVGRLIELGLKDFSISDTVGVSQPKQIKSVFEQLINSFDNAEFGAHFHTRADNWKEKVEAAYSKGCKRFDGAIKGFGGCPMAKDDLVGNMPTENLIDYFGFESLQLKKAPFNEAFEYSSKVFL